MIRRSEVRARPCGIAPTPRSVSRSETRSDVRSNAWLLALVVACHHDAADGEEDKPAPAAVTCAPVAATDVDQTIDATGVIAPPPKVDAIVSSPLAGRVGQVAVEEGDHVEAGALLATIEDPALPAGSLEAKAGVASAVAAKAAAEQELA